MLVQVFRYADEEEPSESYVADDAGLIGENTIKIVLNEANSVVINGFYKYVIELNDDEVQTLRDQREKIEEMQRKIEMQKFGDKFAFPVQ